MLSTSPEQLRRFQPEVAQLFAHAIDDGVTVPFRFFRSLCFLCFLLFLAAIQALLALCFTMVAQLCKVTLLEVFDRGVLGQVFLKSLPEILDENVLDFIGSAFHGCPVVRNLFSFRRQMDILSIIDQRHVDRLVVWRKQKPVMFKSVPLLRTTLATFSTILAFPPAVDRLVVIFCLQQDLLLRILLLFFLFHCLQVPHHMQLPLGNGFISHFGVFLFFLFLLASKLEAIIHRPIIGHLPP
mmetsp:Transcript_17226/g.29324  ORF Transcript_17226/g.29324 Transcript_17226/m.29324 type:complete len:240 (+) Transcript_17226:1492-2211(+)